jgi:hypothetical protein
MNTDVATYQPGALTAPAATFVPDYQSRAVQRLSDWVASADAAYNVAARLVESSFVPQQFRGKPIEATAAILAGSEVGLSPMAALRSFDIIQGQAAPRAITLRAIVQSFGHEIVLEESTSARCIMRGKRRGSTEWQRVTWTMDRATTLGLAGKDGWKKQPTAMLMARATSELCRLVAADAILGIGYTTEELNDGATGEPSEVVEVEAAPEPQATTRRMSRRPKAEPDEAHPVTVEETETPAAPVGESMTQRTRGAMFALLAELGIDDETEQRAGMARILGRPVESRGSLTEPEGQAVVDHLRGVKRQREIDAVTAGA